MLPCIGARIQELIPPPEGMQLCEIVVAVGRNENF